MVFGRLKALPPLHIELYRTMRGLRDTKTGVSGSIGRAVLQWVAKIGDPYIEYCASLVEVR